MKSIFKISLLLLLSSKILAQSYSKHYTRDKKEQSTAIIYSTGSSIKTKYDPVGNIKGSTTHSNCDDIAKPTITGNQTACYGDSIVLTCTTLNQKYKWSNGDTARVMKVKASGSYKVSVTYSGGCKNESVPFAVTILSVIAAPSIANSAITICKGSSINLNATSSGNTIRWYSVSTGGTILATTNSGENYSVTPSNTSTFYADAYSPSGCISPTRSPVVVTVNNVNAPTVSIGNTTICSGNSTTLTATGCSGMVIWSNNSTGSTIVVNITGTYIATCTANGCVSAASNTVNLTVNPNPTTPTANSNSPICAGNTLNLSASGGTSYLWSGTNSFSSTLQNPSLTNVSTLASGTYTITVSNANGCTATATTFITVNPKPSVTASSNSPICAGGTLNLLSTAGTNYVWSGTNSFNSTLQNPSIFNATTVVSGTYMVTVSNVNGCTATATTGVIVNPKPTITVSSNSPICTGATLNLSVTGSTSYAWSGANSFTSTQQNPSITNVSALTSGAYVITVSNANGCTASASIVVIVNPKPTATASSNSPICTGNTLNLSANGGTNYTWSGVNSFSSTQQNPILTNVSTLVSGIYQVMVTDGNSCTATATTVVTVNQKPTVTASSNSPICSGTTLNLSATGGISYIWSGVNSFSSTQQNPILTNVSTLASGTYHVTVSNANGCTASASIAVIVNSKPIITASSNSPICSGTTLNLSATGGISYIWSGVNSFSSTQQNPSINNISTLASGAYQVTITNGNGCTATATTEAIVNSKPIPPTTSSITYCQQSIAIALTATGINTSTLQWYGTNSTGGVASTAAPIPNTTNSGETVYFVSQKDNNTACESNRVSLLVTINPITAPTGTAGTMICSGTTASLLATCTSGNVAWYNSTSSLLLSTTSPYVTPNLTTFTTYNVRCESGSCMSSFVPVSVSINPVTAPTGTAGTTICSGTTTSLSATCTTGNVTWYNSSSSLLLSTISSYITPPLTGTTIYNVRCESGLCQSNFIAISVIVNPKPTITVSSNSPICTGAILNLSATGGTSYIWSGANAFSSSQQNPSISNISTLATGTYMVTVTDGNGCTSTASTIVTVKNVTTPNVSISSTTICSGNSATLTATGCSGTVTWYNSSTGSTAVVNITGTYTATCTENGCVSASSNSVSLTVNPNPTTPTVSSNSPLCAGSTLNLTASGGTSYTWVGVNSFSSTQQNPNLSNVSTSSSGNYQVTITNGNGCTASASIVVTVNLKPTVTVSNNSPLCEGTTLNLSASGGTSYLWSGVNSFSSTQQNPSIINVSSVASGSYQVIITGANNCTAITSTMVTVNPLPAPVIVSESSKFCNHTNLIATGCIGMVTWNNGTTGSAITVSIEGTYTASCLANATNCQSIISNPVIVSFIPNMLTLNGIATNGVQNAGQTISSTQIIPTGTVSTYHAGKSILLRGTFTAQLGSVFTAEIKPCND